MKKGATIAATVVVLIVLAGGSIALVHRSNKPATATSAARQSGTSVPAVHNAILTTKTDPRLGQYLATPGGQPLYTYSGDSAGISKCTGDCLAEWPAYRATSATTNLPAGVSTIQRTDNGQIQYTYHSMPLYTFVDDHGSSVTGNGADGFSIAKPAAASSSSHNASSDSSTPAAASSSGSSSDSGNW